jgi:GAF domain-containing protein
VSRRRAPLREATIVAASVGDALDLPGAQATLIAVTDAACVAFGAPAASIAVVDEHGGELEYVAASGTAADVVVGIRMSARRGLAGYAISAGETIAADDVQRDPRFASDVAQRIGYLPTSIVVAPVMRGDRVLGVLSVLDRTMPAGSAALDLASRFAHVAAGALEMAAATTNLGRAVLEAAARAVESDDRADVAATLRAVADDTPGGDPEIAHLAASLATLRRFGPAERTLAEQLVDSVVRYVSTRRSRR